MAKRKSGIGDFLELGANAFASGLLVAIALAVITLLLATSSQAAKPDEAKTGARQETIVVSGVRGDQPWSVALTPSPDSDAAGVGALWARTKIAALRDEITRGADVADIRAKVVPIAIVQHTPARLQFLLGLLALATAGIAAVAGRSIPARRS
jgi:hypothetical protein